MPIVKRTGVDTPFNGKWLPKPVFANGEKYEPLHVCENCGRDIPFTIDFCECGFEPDIPIGTQTLFARAHESIGLCAIK